MNNDMKKGGGGEGREEKQYMKDPTYPFLSHKLPPDVNEVAYVIAKIYKYGNIDDYAEKLIREDIEKRRKNDDTEDSLREYLERILLPSSADDYYLDENNNNDDPELIPITLRLNKNVAQVGRLIAKHYDEDFDKFVSEEVSKIIYMLSESSSSILTLPSMSDELKQHIHKLLLEGEKEKRFQKNVEQS
jgi:hypothetical protein